MTNNNINDEGAAIAGWLASKAGIRVMPEQYSVVHGRLSNVVKQRGIRMNEFIALLYRGDHIAAREAVDALTIKETSWFRDRHPFDAMTEVIIPEAMKRNAASKQLAIWSAAASTGQELYSVALMLTERFPQLASWSLNLVGTDLSEGALSKAREGRYSQLEIDRGLPSHMVVSYFNRDGAAWRVDDRIRSKVRWSQANLITGGIPAPGRFDIILCRYVLIYFAQEDKDAIVSCMARSLNPGGVLILGSSELTLPYGNVLTPTSHGRAMWLARR